METRIPKIEIDPNNREAYQLIHEGAITLSNVECKGILVDTNHCVASMDRIDKRVSVLLKRIHDSNEANRFKRITGNKLNIDSPKQLNKLFYEIQKKKVKKTTAKGTGSVDESVLEKMGTQFSQDILQYKKLLKAKNNYLVNFLNESTDGILHPMFHLNIAQTYRSSSSNINFQNIPRRNKELNRILRKAIIPPKGAFINEDDYKGIEVMIAYCYHQDPVMRKYLTDPTKDMHGDTALEIFFLDKMSKELKPCRDCTKNTFIFPEFYGDYYVDCAKNIWEYMSLYKLKNLEGLPMREHLRNHGIKNYKDFEEHIKTIEHKFWHVRFLIYTQWKKDWYERYLKEGKFSTLTGFTCRGFMEKNKVINYAIQGTAFHCLLWSLIQIDNKLRKEKARTRIFGQIHDSICSYVYPDESREFYALVEQVLTKDLRSHWEWINLPLSVEHEATLPNESWYYKKELKRQTCKSCKNEWIQKESGVCPACKYLNLEKEK